MPVQLGKGVKHRPSLSRFWPGAQCPAAYFAPAFKQQYLQRVDDALENSGAGRYVGDIKGCIKGDCKSDFFRCPRQVSQPGRGPSLLGTHSKSLTLCDFQIWSIEEGNLVNPFILRSTILEKANSHKFSRQSLCLIN